MFSFNKLSVTVQFMLRVVTEMCRWDEGKLGARPRTWRSAVMLASPSGQEDE